MKVNVQTEFFTESGSAVEGFRYEPEFISREIELSLIESVRALPFTAFKFHAFTANRRTVSFGWKYDYDQERALAADPIPPFLLGIREQASVLARIDPDSLQQISIIEYPPGAGIGWHRDKRVFGDVIGISLLSPCRLRLRRQAGSGWERVSVTAQPRSLYILSGPARHEWEHSIPAVDTLRYSIILRAAGPDTGSQPGQAAALPHSRTNP